MATAQRPTTRAAKKAKSADKEEKAPAEAAPATEAEPEKKELTPEEKAAEERKLLLAGETEVGTGAV